MGMASASSNPKSKKKKGSKKGGGGKSFGSSQQQKSASFDAGASLLKMEKRYEELETNSAKAMQRHDDGMPLSSRDLITQEFLVAARASPSESTSGSLADWVPVAQLVVARPMDHLESIDETFDDVTKAAMSYYCREIFHAAGIGSAAFKSIPRNGMQYSLEPVPSFQKHVYDYVMGNGGGQDEMEEDEFMTKAEARSVLGLEDMHNAEGLDKSTIKQAYRKLSFKLHPDRFMGEDRNDDEVEATNKQYARVKLAYETLSSGVLDKNVSWYASLGGKARNEFSGPISLMSLSDAKAKLDGAICDSAVVGLDPDLVQSFVTRNQANSM